jgi:hypothetical protein
MADVSGKLVSLPTRGHVEQVRMAGVAVDAGELQQTKNASLVPSTRAGLEI